MAEATTTEIKKDLGTEIPATEKYVSPDMDAQYGGSNAAAEMAVNVGSGQHSYMCEYCGKVNPITAPKCTRCGKRRPRKEYVKAMKNSADTESIKDRYIAEQAQLAVEKEDAVQTQLVRLVESRVADEKAQIIAQDEIRIEQETDAIKRATARDAVLRIIAAERDAEERVKAAERRAEDAVSGRNREADERIATEREKVLYAAAKRVVSERAGIENAAEERINAERRSVERKAQESIAFATEEAEKSAARRAVLKVVATEQAAEDRARIERDAISRAALDRVAEERRIAEINAYSKYEMEKEAIQRAVDERIKAEREMLYGRKNAAPAAPKPQYVQQPVVGGVQPLAIVPYVNPQQPLYQYNTKKVVYKFVPDEVPAEAPAQEKGAPAPVKKEKKCPRAWSIITLIFALALIAGTVLAVLSLNETNIKSLLDPFTGNITLTVEGLLPPIGLVLTAVGAIACVIIAIVGAARNNACCELPVMATVGLVGIVALGVGMKLANYDYNGLLNIGMLVALIAGVIMFIAAIIAKACSPKKEKKAKKA